MDEYLGVIENVLENGSYKENRTGIDTISHFSHQYKVDLREGFPLLTTKDLSGFRWNSLIYELLWYLSGEEHIKNLREHTSIWDAWATENGELDTAYGRFWRRFPIPDGDDALQGETWASITNTKWDDSDDVSPARWVNTEADGRRTFDQLQYVIDMLRENPHSRRLVVNAWHPANATVSTLPPCHYSFVFNVQNGTLNTHLTQRSGDVALGVPFNIACYSILTHIIANQVGLDVGEFSHTIVDAHIYCGADDRGAWYADNLSELQNRLVDDSVSSVQEWIASENTYDNSENDDHVPNLLEQLTREPYQRPTLEVADKPLDELEFSDIQLQEYNSHEGLSFGVAE